MIAARREREREREREEMYVDCRYTGIGNGGKPRRKGDMDRNLTES